MVPLLFQTVLEFLGGRENAQFILCHIPRADVSHEVLQEKIKQFDLSFQVLPSSDIETSNLPEDCSMDDAKRALIYLITKN